MQNYKLTVCYDGSRYRGWQRQGNTDNTIQYKLETALGRILGQDIELAACGRTDAGVHAEAQVCSFKAATQLACDEILGRLREYLPEDIGALTLSEAEPRFHARLSCKEKSYVYSIWNSDGPNVFRRKYMYALADCLDTQLMRAAADKMLGTHDFTAFCSNKHMKKSAVRTVRSIAVERFGNELRLTFTGDGFLYNQVRIMVGTLIEAGRGERSAESVERALILKDRSLAGFTAPAQGLTLHSVKY